MEKIERLYEIAERIVSRCEVSEPVFSEHCPINDNDFPRDIVTVVTEGRLAGRLFGSWLPISGEMYRNPEFKELIIERSRSTWRQLAKSSLVPIFTLMGPKGKLPA